MTHDQLINETEIRRFLLGDMTGEERAAFEERFIADHDAFENVRVVEDELIEGYIRETLVPEDRSKFEANFLTTPKRRERVAFTREMLAKMVSPQIIIDPGPTFWISIVAFFTRPSVGFAAVLLVIVGVAAGWLMLNRNARPVEIVRQETPTPTPVLVVIDPPANNTPDKNINKPPASDNTNKTANKPEEVKQQPVVTLALFAGTMRSGGQTANLDLPKDAKGANLLLSLESDDYKTYRADLVDQDGSLVYRGGRLTPRGSKLTFFVPATALQNGDYMIKITGLDSSNHAESVADYQFRVNRK